MTLLASPVSAEDGGAASLPHVDPAWGFILFLAFFVPGFITVQIYRLLVPGDQLDFSKNVNEMVGYSAINYAIGGWLIVISNYDFRVAYFVVFVLPILLPIIILSIRKRFLKATAQPQPTPWDWFFRHAVPGKTPNGLYVRVKTKNGTIVGGYYAENSAASTYPQRRELYLEKAYVVNADGTHRAMNDTFGIIVSCEDAEYVLFRKEIASNGS